MATLSRYAFHQFKILTIHCRQSRSDHYILSITDMHFFLQIPTNETKCILLHKIPFLISRIYFYVICLTNIGTGSFNRDVPTHSTAWRRYISNLGYIIDRNRRICHLLTVCENSFNEVPKGLWCDETTMNCEQVYREIHPMKTAVKGFEVVGQRCIRRDENFPSTLHLHRFPLRSYAETKTGPEKLRL